jgi:hypothetical protein
MAKPKSLESTHIGAQVTADNFLINDAAEGLLGATRVVGKKIN